MFNLSKLTADKKAEVKTHFINNDYDSIGSIFVEYRVASCAECAYNFSAIKAWCEYWINIGEL